MRLLFALLYSIYKMANLQDMDFLSISKILRFSILNDSIKYTSIHSFYPSSLFDVFFFTISLKRLSIKTTSLSTFMSSATCGSYGADGKGDDCQPLLAEGEKNFSSEILLKFLWYLFI